MARAYTHTALPKETLENCNWSWVSLGSAEEEPRAPCIVASAQTGVDIVLCHPSDYSSFRREYA